MFIRYHFIYYAIGLLLYVVTFYYHWIFAILYILYLLFILKRLGLQSCVLMVCLCFLIHLRDNQTYSYPSSIKGTIIRCGDNYDYVKTNQGVIKLYNDYDFWFNDEVEINVEYMDINVNSNDYAFNEKLYLKGQNIFYKAQLLNVQYVEHHKTLYHIIESRLSSDEHVSSYQKLLLLGEKDENIEDDYQTLSDLSLVHLFALSGMHVSILSALFLQITGLFFSKPYNKYLAFVLIGIYVFSIPFSISLMRAFFTMVLYDAFKKYINKLDVFGILLIVSLFYNPYYIYNISFVFSYFIYFIVLITKKIKNSFFYIYLSSIPIILNVSYEFSPLSLLSADVLNPFVEIFYILNCLSIVFPFLNIILILCVSCLESIILFLNQVSLRFIVGKPNLSFIVLYYLLFFLIIVKKEKKESVHTLICILISLVLSFSFYNRYKIYGQVTMIDVGQGDCTLLRLPFNRANILIDTGGNKDYDLAVHTLIPYLKASGISHLDYVYISHDDYDHNGALASLIENFNVKCVVDKYEPYRIIHDLKVEMYEHSTSSDSNDNSLVIRFNLPSLSLLFMGDASVELEDELVKKEYDLSADVIKIGHHGSASSTSSLLLDNVKPSVAMIGVKKNNIYKHPSKEVIERLKRKGIYILRTDLHGMFHILFYNNKNYYIYE